MKNIAIIGFILAVIDVAVLGVMRILDLISGDNFSGLLTDSLLVIAILFVAASVINFVVGSLKK